MTVKSGPNRIVRSVDTSHQNVSVTMPDAGVFERYRTLFERAEQNTRRRVAGESVRAASEAELSKFVVDTIAVTRRAKAAAEPGRTRLDPRALLHLPLQRGRAFRGQPQDRSRQQAARDERDHGERDRGRHEGAGRPHPPTPGSATGAGPVRRRRALRRRRDHVRVAGRRRRQPLPVEGARRTGDGNDPVPAGA